MKQSLVHCADLILDATGRCVVPDGTTNHWTLVASGASDLTSDEQARTTQIALSRHEDPA